MNSPDTKHVADLGRGPERTFDNSLKHINGTQLSIQTLSIIHKHSIKTTTSNVPLWTADFITRDKKMNKEENFLTVFAPKTNQLLTSALKQLREPCKLSELYQKLILFS